MSSYEAEVQINLFVVFALVCISAALAILRIAGVLQWPWWAVFAPVWVPLLGSIVICAAIAVFMAFGE